MQQLAILWPVLTLALLTYSIWFILFWQRFALMKRTPPEPGDFATAAAATRYFEPAEMPANNLRNLFEMPVLFYALVPLLLVTQAVTGAQLALAWFYVVLRIIHSLIHVTAGPVIARFVVYLVSCAVLLAMWIGFAVDVLIMP